MDGMLYGVIAVAFAIWAMVSVAKSGLQKEKKVMWFAVVILIPVLGPILYWLLYSRKA